ncbi:MAG: DUF5615 family PIN-like protein [Opitutae bacterium]|nr:DUF5615 family PIN-like protein [Opitutae bacterium]
MKIVIDMNLSPAWVSVFAQHGIPATHWSTVGSPTAPDSEIFAWARAHDHAIFTHDLDFAMILAVSRSSKPSVVQLRHPDVHPARHGERIVRVIAQFSSELGAGALISIEPDKERVRLLPLND